MNKTLNYFVNTLNGMAMGLFGTLIIGTIISQIGTYGNIPLLVELGTIGKYLTAPAIAMGVAYKLNADMLTTASAIVVATFAGGTIISGEAGYMLGGFGEPVSAYVATLATVQLAKLVSGKTSVDVIITPLFAIILGGIVASIISPPIASLISFIGSGINTMTEMQPLVMGILIAVSMGMLLTMPISSAAIAISLGLSGLAAGAAAVGCSTQMIGFAVMSYKENGLGGLLSQGIGTSMIQFPNIVKKPTIWLPTIFASAILGPISTVAFEMTNTATGAGMGTSGLVGQIEAVASGVPAELVILMHIILPAILTITITKAMIKKGLFTSSDLKLNLK